MTDADTNRGVNTSEVAPGDKSGRRPIVELRNGKLVLKQKILSFEKMSETMQEIVKFREMLEQRLEAKEPPLSAIPEEHKPVIAKLVHESDKNLQALSKHVQQQLLPAVDEDEEENLHASVLPLHAVEAAIKSVAKRVNYGLDAPAGGAKVPAAWLIWRWEVCDSCRDWLPKNAWEKVDNRFRERQQAKEDANALFEALPESERIAILGAVKTGVKATIRSRSGAKGIPSTGIVDLTDSGPDAPQASATAPLQPRPSSEIDAQERMPAEDTALDASSEKKPVGRPKKVLDPKKSAERAAKEKELLEKKAAKAEREKREQAAQAKSRSLMASFFGKAKPASTSNASPSKLATNGENARNSPAPATSQTDFERTFKPFALKKGAVLAPVNWFSERKRREQQKKVSRTEDNVIVIEDDGDNKVDEDVDMDDVHSAQILESPDPKERLRDILARLSPGLNPPMRPKQPTGYKTYWPISVRGLMSQLTEAEVAGDDSEVRRLLVLLRSRCAIPAKVFVFAEDARPGYFGTFTRSSREVGPRTPFARDIVAVDYGYDSGLEWAEEDTGDADDVVEGDGEEDDADEGEEDSDLDSWLVDDDEVEDPGTPIEERAGSPGFGFEFPSQPQQSKRKKEEKERHGSSKKRRVIVPLVPFTKGPQWEPVIGRCTYEPFKPYCIQLFNDTPFPIDPFTFVSHPIEQSSSGHQGRQTSDGFLIPALPPHVAKSACSTSSLPAPSTSQAAGSSAPPAKRVAKTPFPEVHLPHLLSRIEELATSSLHCIVETVHRELQAHRVKKNAIEAKVREVGEKCKEKKVWVVRSDVKVIKLVWHESAM
ncbi:hypothetical protein BN946_scf184798.g31 [Trametes cinnabarina]|uniref:Chromatin assembly factor 1 subunit A dimerization domain-containing protein n=1 Tax=Pycnoporus cinnabarinus TaxID=5643 RepID=A0A060S8Y8_PYCCI|nr:hypothetical protein BN946_scf184798.g31 [Trametes cinnabarina]